MPGTTLRPNGTVFHTMWTYEHNSAHEALADDQWGSAVQPPPFSVGVGETIVNVQDFALPAGAVVRYVQPRFQYQPVDLGFNTDPKTQLQIDGVWQGVQHPGVAGSLVTNATPAFTAAYSAAQINGMLLYLDGRHDVSSGYSSTRFSEAYLDVVWAMPPTTRVTGPTGTLRINNPTVTWEHRPGADAPGGQDAYRIVIYDTATGTRAYDTGEVAGAVSSAVTGPLALAKQYVALVYTRQTTNGVAQWSTDVSPVLFSLDVTGPTVAVTAPTGVQATTSPTVRWTHTPGAGAQTGQTHYRVRAFKSTDLINPLYDTGVVASGAALAVIGPLDGTLAWRAVVNTAQTTYGAQQWSPDAFTTFTIDAVPATITSVTPTPHHDEGTIVLSIARNTSSPMWLTIDVEATYDGATTWQTVRNATHLSVNGNTAFVTDYEAPNDKPVQYRARATRIVSGVPVTGPWVLSPTTSWHIAGNEVWIKDPAHPERNIQVCVSNLPTAVYDRTVGVFRPVGAHYPVVVSDVLQSPSLTASVLTSTGPEADAFLLAVSASVVLVQSPAQPWGWGSRYVAPGPVAESRTKATSTTAVRLWDITMTEVARPADETAT